MSTTIDTLNKVLTNVQNNREQIVKQIAASKKALPTDVAVLDAIEVLIKAFNSNVQEIGQTIGAKLQIDSMEANLPEFEALIAGLHVVLADDTNVDAATALIVAGATASDPLSVAAGDSSLAAANDVQQPAEVAAVIAEAPAEGTAEVADSPVNGTVAS
jgi:hypothetical protein